MRKRRVFSRDFKINAVKMVTHEKRVAAQVARDLGITSNLLHSWKLKYTQEPNQAFPGKGNLNEQDAYLRKIERENLRLKEEINILKKATVYFANNP
jgi:transposase